MLNSARQRLRDDIAHGDSAAAVDDKVARAGPALDEEQQAALWLYAWHHAGGDDPAAPAAHGARPPGHLGR